MHIIMIFLNIYVNDKECSKRSLDLQDIYKYLLGIWHIGIIPYY